jgi:hypothetical protein
MMYLTNTRSWPIFFAKMQQPTIAVKVHTKLETKQMQFEAKNKTICHCGRTQTRIVRSWER